MLWALGNKTKGAASANLIEWQLKPRPMRVKKMKESDGKKQPQPIKTIQRFKESEYLFGKLFVCSALKTAPLLKTYMEIREFLAQT